MSGLQISRVLLLALLLITTAGRAANINVREYRINGVDYVRLDHWAQALNFDLKWRTSQPQELRLVNEKSSLVFTLDSRRMALNGVCVWLSFPLVVRQGVPYVSAVDLNTALRPALFPPKLIGGKKIATICLDPGHGGRDPGNREGKQQEKQYTLLLAKEVRSQLSKAGFKVILTRSSDRFVELDDRPRFAKQRGADLFLSLHFNSADGPGGASAQGVEVYCMTPAGA